MLERLNQLTGGGIDENKKEGAYQGKIHKDSNALAAEAVQLLQSGDKAQAWNKAMKAFSKSNTYGWVEYNDGGTRINACRILQQVDKEKGQEVTFVQFAEDLSHGLGYSEMHYTSDIAHLLCDDIDVLRLFEEQFGYMNRILREDSVCNEDCLDISFDDTDVLSAIRLAYIAKMSIMSLSERAKMLLVKLIVDGCENALQNIQSAGATVRIILEIAIYARELNVDSLTCFLQIAKNNATSNNYLYRILAKSILSAVGEDIPPTTQKALPAIYNMYLPEVFSLCLRTVSSPYDGYVDWKNSCSVMRVVSHVMGYLSYCTTFKKINIATRAFQLMQENGSIDDWDDTANHKVGSHYRSIGLYYPYRRPHSKPAIDAMMEVASELLDCGAVDGKYNDNVFLPNGFNVIKLKDQPKPDFIARLTERDSWTMPKM